MYTLYIILYSTCFTYSVLCIYIYMIYAWFKLGSSREHGDGSTGSIDKPHLRRTPRPREPRGQGHIGATIEHH